MRTLTHKMRTLTYNMPNDIHTYVITCPNDLLGMYVRLLIENGAYEIYVDNEVFYEIYADNEVFYEGETK